jgi:hypothetical protein
MDMVHIKIVLSTRDPELGIFAIEGGEIKLGKLTQVIRMWRMVINVSQMVMIGVGKVVVKVWVRGQWGIVMRMWVRRRWEWRRWLFVERMRIWRWMNRG